MKRIHVFLLVAAVIVVDQALKFYIKTNFYIGQDLPLLGTWFHLHFVENEGMAWGWKLGENGSIGKMMLTLFRIAAVCFGVYYINRIIREKKHPGFIVSVALIFSGALGNLIDSLFYGLLFDASDPFAQNVARFLPPEGGYAGFLHGKVVDMLYFPLFDGVYPKWVPFFGGNRFEFFSFVFNLADASITIGLFIILLFQKRFFKDDPPKQGAVETNVSTADEAQVL